jgi:hypothetical protein
MVFGSLFGDFTQHHKSEKKKEIMARKPYWGKKTCNFSKIWTYILHNGNNCVKDLIKAFLNSY